LARSFNLLVRCAEQIAFSRIVFLSDMMQQRNRQVSPTFRSTLSLTDSACAPSQCSPTPRRARGAGQSPQRSQMVLNDAAPQITKSQSYCPVADSGCPQGGKSYFLHGSRAHVPGPRGDKVPGFGAPETESTPQNAHCRKHFKSLLASNNSQHFASGTLIGQTPEYTSKRDDYNKKFGEGSAGVPSREVLKEKQSPPQLQSRGFEKAMADLPPSPRRVSRRAMSPQAHLQSPGVAKSFEGKNESPCRRQIRKGSPKKEFWSFGDAQSPRVRKQTERSPEPSSPRRTARGGQSPRARSPAPPWGTENDTKEFGFKPGASPIRNHMSSEEAKNMQLRGKHGYQPGTFGAPLSARPPRTSGKVPPLRYDPTVPKQCYFPTKVNPEVIHERQFYYGGA